MPCTFGLLCGKRANITASQRNYYHTRKIYVLWEKKVTPGTRRGIFRTATIVRINTTAVYHIRTHLYLVRIIRKTRVTLSECQTQWEQV